MSNGIYLGRISDTSGSEDDLACCAVKLEGPISEKPICKSGSLCQPPHSSVSQQNYCQDGNVQDTVSNGIGHCMTMLQIPLLQSFVIFV